MYLMSVSLKIRISTIIRTIISYLLVKILCKIKHTEEKRFIVVRRYIFYE